MEEGGIHVLFPVILGPKPFALDCCPEEEGLAEALDENDVPVKEDGVEKPLNDEFFFVALAEDIGPPPFEGLATLGGEVDVEEEEEEEEGA